jgi:hypothetical protein
MMFIGVGPGADRRYRRLIGIDSVGSMFCGDGGMIVHEAQRVVGDGSVWRPRGDWARCRRRGRSRRLPRALFGESGILADDEAPWRTPPLPQRCAGWSEAGRQLRASGRREQSIIWRGRRPRTPRAAVPVPGGTSGRKRPDRAARLSGGPRSAPAHPAQS